MKILLAEDDIQLNTTISNFLKLKKYEISTVFDGEDAIKLIDKSKFDLYIIDINLPNINGLEILEYIRSKAIQTPIIIITASLELANFKKAFENGCNEYIKKPFYLEELEIRINNLLENSSNSKKISLTKSLSYDLKYEELKNDGEIIKLRKKERRLLTIFLQNVNKTVSTEQLEHYVWENEIKESYPLRQLLSELRKKLGNENDFIKSYKGIGYCFEIKK